MSSSSSSLGSRESNPSRTMQWQVVQAQDFSQACSISIWLRSATSRMVSPLAASTTIPSGQSVSWGRKMIFGILHLVYLMPLQGLANGSIHPAGGEFGGGVVHLGDGGRDGLRICAIPAAFQPDQRRIDDRTIPAFQQ